MVQNKASAHALRFLSIDAINQANSGHPGLPMGMADVLTILFQEFLTFYPDDPDWANRDRFVLSAGHGSMLLYSVLHLCGYPKMTLDEIKNFRQLDSLTPGHPEHGLTPGVEATTGPLGQGLAMAVGMAIGQQLLEARVGGDYCNHKIYALCGDGDLMEGISQEALSFAGNLALKNLIVLFDDNGITIDGSTALSTRDDALARFSASGWIVMQIDGHNETEIREALHAAQSHQHPTLIACKTTIGYGSPTKAGTSACHGSPLGAQERQLAASNLGWPYEPFDIPADIRKTWATAARRHKSTYEAWKEAVKNASTDIQKYFDSNLEVSTHHLFQTLKETFYRDKTFVATRVSSQLVLEALMPALPQLIGGSADLTPSNNTKTKTQKHINANDFTGSYIHFGIREHAMAAALNGLSLYGGFIPYGGTFLVFSDYMRPAMRLSALMEQGVIYVLTHDSIGLGEDGPTHQPVEHLTALRVIPNLLVFRPADAMETAECWQCALSYRRTPSVLALSRQNLPIVREKLQEENLSAKGGYVVKETAAQADVTLIASGSEVMLACNASDRLAKQNIQARVVSMPCLELFASQTSAYQQAILGEAPRIMIEAGLDVSWQKYMRVEDTFIGMSHFGASAPADVLFKKFNITVDTIVETAERKKAK